MASRKPALDTASLLAEYASFPPDQDVTEPYAAARLNYSRAWLQLRRCVGGGPVFHRTPTGKIRYKKADIEAFREKHLTAYSNTSQYSKAA